MPKREIIVLDGMPFKTKKACKEYVRNIIQGLKIGERVKKEHTHFNLFNDLIQRHSEKEGKIGCGIKYFFLCLDGFKNRYMKIMRLDKTDIDFSWSWCIETRKENPFFLLTQAMRFEVKSQILDFRFQFQAPFQCNTCNIMTNEIEIDHIIEFKDLVSKFIEINPNIPTTFDDESTNYHNAVFKECDRDFANHWNEYHKNQSILQLLCVSCHKTKTYTSKITA